VTLNTHLYDFNVSIKNHSQNSLRNSSTNKLVSSKSVSSPLSGFSTTQSQNNHESIKASIKKRFSNHSSFDYGADEAAVLLDMDTIICKEDRAFTKRGYLNKYSKY